MALIQRRIGADAVEVPFAGHIPQPNALGTLDYEIERCVVSRPITLLSGDEFSSVL
jgi:hypothetical protein